ncbi:F-box only protein 7 isoform X2 [Sebastes fasciatus]|uniref:F-box only protein 7 isoform X2 n=1 Tax=Sebastes fasciatus TaxID=394691 RepID=UPI003D9E63E9
MKLRVRINRQTSRVELPGEEPSLKELTDLIKDTVLSSHGFSADTQFRLSLNGSELLTDSGQTLSSCGIVSGDLVCVVLPQSAADNSTNSINPNNTTNPTNSNRSTNPNNSTNPTNPTNSNRSTNSNNPTHSNSSTNRPTSSSENQRPQQNQQTAAMTSNQVSDSPLEPGHAAVEEPGSSSSSSSSRPARTESKETGEVLDSDPAAPSWEPMLCSEAEDGQAPLSLELLHHSAQTSSPSDAIMVAGHLLMIETGFVPQGCELKAGEMPAGWRSPAGLYKLQYSHPLCESSLAMVVAVSMGATLVINATLKVNETVDTVRKLCLNPSSYVTNEWPESAAAAFRDLNKLSRLFKDQLAYPLIAAAREAMALPVAFGLAALPPELLLRVLRLLDVQSVVRLSSVSRHFNVSTADSSLWRHLYRRDFSARDVNRSRDTDWRERYKRFYQIRSDLHHAARHHPVPPFHRNPRDLFSCVPVPFHPAVPGIIGGEYDQRPSLPYALLPRPRHDPIGPPPGLNGRLPRVRPTGGRPADIRRGFI